MKVAIYTCITGNYDVLMQPLTVEVNCDYYLISDFKLEELGAYKWIDVQEVVPDDITDMKDMNRYCKMHPFELFSDYDYSIYLDGSIQIINEISHYVSQVGKTGIAVHRHRKSNDIYSEGIFLSWLGAVDKDKLVDDMKRYMLSGFPRNFGMFECGMIVTDLNNQVAYDVYDRWYDEYMKSSKRDQQSFVFSLWTLGYCAEDVGNICGDYNIFTNPDIRWNRGSHYR